MEDWQLFRFVQSAFVGLLFSFLLAKLISMVVAFREKCRSIDGGESVEKESKPSSSESKAIGDNLSTSSAHRASVEEPSLAERGNEGNTNGLTGDDNDSDDDWEGVEITELDEEFSAASAFVAATAVNRLSQKVPNDVQLQLYGLYKIATEGPCNVPQPSALKITARAKWQAWKKLGAMPPEEAMQKYTAVVTELYPSWATGSTSIKDGDNSDSQSRDTKALMGPVFSTFVYEEESGNDLKMDAIHAFAREGDEESFINCIESGVPVNLKDSEGRTPLHWAVDRGHVNITELLVNKNADVNAQDKEGHSPLHYAAVCGRESIAELLVKKNADTNLKDNDGNSPYDLCDTKWPLLQHALA